MSEPTTIPPIDPERLKVERGNVDLGSDEETHHDHIGREQGRPPADSPSIEQPTSGVTPPAR